MDLPPLATTSIGSFPRPRWLAETDRGHARFRLSGAELTEAQDDATAVSIKEQEELGLDIVTDGEQRRERFVYHALSTWDGIDMVNTAVKTRFRGRENYPQVVPRVIGALKRREPACVADVRFAKARTRQPLKLAVAGPMTIVDSTADEFYGGDEAALAMDAAIATNAELRDLQDAGCDMLQIDEPAMTRYHDKVLAYGARCLDRCLDGIRVPTIVHLCYGYPGGLALQHHITYPQLLDALMTTRIGGVSVEFGRSEFDPAVLAPFRERLIMFGCVDPGASPAPSAEAVKRRVMGLLERVRIDPRRVLLAPDCGLMTIPRDLARAKIAAMVNAAKDLRRAL
jgi:5-methyltetrahydropteroyltriglutamate--homocysteine methyltransferase